MQNSNFWRRGLWIIIGTIMLAMPATALGQGRGRGRGPNLDKKCGKFVNCHDASEGRVDGRGPQRNVGVLGNGVLLPRTRVRPRVRANDTDEDGRFHPRRLRYRNDNRYDVRRQRLQRRDLILARAGLGVRRRRHHHER